ncbi:phage tail protein [Pantoea sp. Acro-835]|uniref:Phage tail protein n=1 Tax=Candidatus Pantoea multigeneris TaxID=2608357 RepID=A0ABX0R703_9GAMM|nr:phage tail protein [Pantoea multigeneris]NIF20554.1 phage tail protein [Pantoea multigeneris]
MSRPREDNVSIYQPELNHRFLASFVLLGLVPDPLSFKFASITGLGYQLQTRSIHEGGHNASNRVLPQRSTTSNLVFDRGVMIPTPMSVGVQLILSEFLTSVTYFDITIMLLGESGKPQSIWMASDALPVRMQYGALDADSGQPLINSFEFTCRSIEWLGVKL